MARPVNASPANLATKSARDTYTAAKEKAEKAPQDTKAKDALAKARAELDKAISAENRERFTRVGGGRINAIILGIENASKAFNPNSYEFTEADVEKTISAIRTATTALETKMRAGLNAPKTGDRKRKVTETKFTF